MQEAFSSFTNREWAILIWLVILLLLVLTKRDVRTSISNLLRVLSTKISLIIFSLMFLYVSLQVFLFSRTHLWEGMLIKDLLIWLMTFGFGSIVNVNFLLREKGFFAKLMEKNFKLMVLAEFLINFYTFPLLIELILVPVSFFLFGIAEYSKRDEKFSIVRKLMNCMIGCIGIVMLVYVVISLCTRIEDLITIDNMLSFVFPIYLSITFIPFVYLLGLYVFYENIIIVSRHLLRKKKGLGEYFTKKILLHCRLNLFKLIKFNREKRKYILNLKSKKAIDKLFT